MEAYGFNTKDDLLAQILKLNLDIAAKEAAGQTVIAPGIPTGYPNPTDLISDDCITAE